MFHVSALTDQAGLLTGYYAFPFVVSLAWPLVWPWLQHRQPPNPMKKWAIATFSTGLALSIIGGWLSPTAGTVDLSHLSHPANVRAFNRFTAAVEVQDNFDDVVVDESVAALLPHQFRSDQWLGSSSAIATPSTLLYCEPGLQPEQVGAVARSQAFTQQFQIQGTPLRMQTNRNRDQFNSQFQNILKPIE